MGRHTKSIEILEAEESSALAAQSDGDDGLSIGIKQLGGIKKPNHTRIIAFANQKGGVGKTTSAVNISAALAVAGLKVLLIDADMQSNSSSAFGCRGASISLYDVFTGEKSIADIVVQNSKIPNLKIAPASIDMAGLELELGLTQHREYILRDALIDYLRQEGPVDFVIIDCPPSLSLVTVNTLVAATEVLIPVQAEYYALEGMAQLINSINLVSQGLNPPLKVSAILMTMVNHNTNLARSVIEEIRNAYPTLLMETMIPRNVKLGEAPSFEESIITYDGKSRGAIAYQEAAWELAARE